MKQYWNDKNWDYKRYVKAQTALNKKKIKDNWVQESEIKFIAEFISGRGICHGARNGNEVKLFRKYVGETIGTDISDNAPKYGLVRWDMHRINKEWSKQFDWVYTNCLDHSYNPELAIMVMSDQLKRGGKLIIHDNGEMDHLRNEIFNEADCFGASHEELLELLKDYDVEFHKTGHKKRIIYICSYQQS